MMLGKESLEELLKTLEHYQGRNTIFDILHSKVILVELDLLEKYEKAFEILKENKLISINLGTENFKIDLINTRKPKK